MNTAQNKYFKEFQSLYNFMVNDPNVYDKAFCHKSYSLDHNLPYDNEVLEFFGDAILKFCVSDLLFKEFEELGEGELTKIRAVLVCDQTLSDIGFKHNLNHCLKLGRNTKPLPSIMAQAIEALFAAIYLDNDIKEINSVIYKIFKDHAYTTSQDELKNNFKASLQEYTQGKTKELPIYEITKVTGPEHNKVFEVKVTVFGREMGKARGKSIKEAQQYAAKIALEKLNII